MALTPGTGQPLSGEAATQRLAAVRAKRGYLLPHHGLLAIAAPELLDAYDATYTALTLTPRSLSIHDKEFVWLAILVSTEEAIATHHLAKFDAAGGTPAEFEMAIRLAGVGRSAPSFAFAAEHWQKMLPGYDRDRAYNAAVRATAGDTAPRLVAMAMAGVQTCLSQWWALAAHIRAAYAAGVSEIDLAEALALTMFPGSVPNFVEACAVWRDVIRRGEVPASDGFRAWATAPGQDGYGR